MQNYKGFKWWVDKAIEEGTVRVYKPVTPENFRSYIEALQDFSKHTSRVIQDEKPNLPSLKSFLNKELKTIEDK